MTWSTSPLDVVTIVVLAVLLFVFIHGIVDDFEGGDKGDDFTDLG